MAKVRILVALAAFGAVGAIFASPAYAGSSCQTCQVQPATVTTVTKTETTSTRSFHIHVRVVRKVREKIKQFERVNHVIVAINMVPNGISRKGCVDPTKLRIGFKAGDSFRNTRLDGSPFWEAWEQQWRICNPKLVKIGGKLYLKGTKENCGNENILIPVHPEHQHEVVERVIVFKTVKLFESTYDKWFKETTHSRSITITVTTTHLSCHAGFTLRGNQCFHCPPCPQAHAWLKKTAILNGNVVHQNGGEFGFSVTVNGHLAFNTTNAASGQNRNLGPFNAGDDVKACETRPGGYTPDQVCIEHIMQAGETFVFPFVNRKNSQKPCQPKVSSTRINDVQAGGTSPNYRVTATLCSGDSGTLQINPDFGHMDPSDGPNTGIKTYHVGPGVTTFTLTYVAPTEVPQGDSSRNVPSGDDQIANELTTSNGQAEDVQNFPIDPPPPATAKIRFAPNRMM